jgi:hypothetical protein
VISQCSCFLIALPNLILLSQLLKQRLGFFQVSRVKALGEPPVHRRQQVDSVLALVLGLPQTGQTGSGAEFPGFGLVVTGEAEGLVEAAFGIPLPAPAETRC